MRWLFFVLFVTQLSCASLEKRIESYILSHPEVIVSAIKKHQDRVYDQKMQQIGEIKDADIVLHQGNGKDRLIAYIDYRCSACRRSAGFVDAFIKNNPGVSLIIRPLPILGGDSIAASLMMYDCPKKMRNRLHLAMLSPRVALDLRALSETYQVSAVTSQYEKHPAFPLLEAHYQQSMSIENQSVPLYIIYTKNGYQALHGLEHGELLQETYMALQ